MAIIVIDNLHLYNYISFKFLVPLLLICNFSDKLYYHLLV